jgi:hypothetical protein
MDGMVRIQHRRMNDRRVDFYIVIWVPEGADLVVEHGRVTCIKQKTQDTIFVKLA